jgi:hypothetical protein
MLDWLKKKLTNWYKAQQLNYGDYTKPHYRKLTNAYKKELGADLVWHRGQSKKNYYASTEETINLVKERTGRTINLIGGEWYYVEYK